MIRSSLVGTLLSLSLVVPAVAEDQPKEGRLRLSGSFVGTAGQLGSEPAYAAALGYRLSRRFSIDLELTGIPEAGLARGPFRGDGAREVAVVTARGGTPSRGPMVPGPGQQPVRGNMPVQVNVAAPVVGFARGDAEAFLATTNLRAEFRADNERVRPYVTGGFGVARLESELEVPEVAASVQIDPRQPGGRGFMVGVDVRPGVASLTGPRSGSQTDLAFVAGGGVSVRLVKGLFVDAEARYFRLLDPGRNVGRFGGGLSYRF